MPVKPLSPTAPAITSGRSRTRHPRGWIARLRLWIALSRERRQLARLDAAALDDLGLTRAEAEREARRPFWDGPARR